MSRADRLGASREFSLASADVFVLFLLALTMFIPLLAILGDNGPVHISVYFLTLVCFVLFLLVDSMVHRSRDFSFYVFVPLLLSAVQNIYLGIVAPAASSIGIQVMVVSNFVFALGFLFVLSVQCPRCLLCTLPRAMVLIGVGLAAYGVATFVTRGGSMISALSSLRNIEAPVIFFTIGLLAARRTSQRYYSYIVLLGWFIILFGFFERFIYGDAWQSMNIGVLWTKKGLGNVTPSGIPANFYSSELIGGKPFRRMVSSYADAVNFGTVLFLIFMVAWFRRRKWLMLASVAAIFLAVSKGALLGLLVFAVIWSFYRADRGFFLIASAVSLLFGGGFVVYSWFHSTKSLFGHVLGFVSALRVLVSHPWGYGLGNIGTLAAQFSTTPRVQPGIRESGLGMVIGQLGVVGLLLYASLFRLILRRVALLPPRERVLGFSLFVGIVLNILFNEVALSPNSCAGHFLTLGMLCAPAVLWTNTRAEPGRSFS